MAGVEIEGGVYSYDHRKEHIHDGHPTSKIIGRLGYIHQWPHEIEICVTNDSRDTNKGNRTY